MKCLKSGALVLLAALAAACASAAQPVTEPGRADPGGIIDQQIASLRADVTRLQSQTASLSADLRSVTDVAGMYDVTFVVSHSYSDTGCNAQQINERIAFVSQTFCPVNDGPLSCRSLFGGNVHGGDRIENVGLRVTSRSRVDAVYCRVHTTR